MTKKAHGGARKGAGAKKKPPTKVITFRVRLNEIEPIRAVVKKEIKKLRGGK